MEGKLKLKYLFIILFSIVYNPVVYSRESISSAGFIPDNYEVRREYKNIIYGSNSEIENQKIAVSESFLTGKMVRFSVIKKETAYYFIFINEELDSFTFVSPGTYIIKRNINTGEIEQIKIFLKKSKDTYVRITEKKGKTLFEMSLYGSSIYRDIILPVSIEEIIVSPFEKVVELSEYMVNWSFLDTGFDMEENRKLENIRNKIKENLASLEDSDDGAQDKNGEFIFINNLSPQKETAGFNCSGFVKWICDGLYYASTRKLMDIESLKNKNIDKRATVLNSLVEEERDPFFGLDWTRNIALQISGLSSDPGSTTDPGEIDVRNYPFSEYIYDRGYRVSDLKTILYYLAKKEPGYFYLASVNGDFGSSPVLRQHYHVAALIPSFSCSGEFTPEVFERNVNTGIDDFIARYSGEYIHLVKIKADYAYILPVTALD